MANIVEQIASITGEQSWKGNVLQTLKQGKQFLKRDYKMQVQLKSTVVDYCISHALSDKHNSLLQFGCMNHKHDQVCSECINIEKIIDEIESKINAINYQNSVEKESASYDLANARDSISEWKKHLLRAVHQDKVKFDILKKLQSNEALLHLDWAMKWIGTASREDQSSWFGKRGVPRHIAVAISLAQKDEYESHTYVHVFDQTPQDAATVIAIIGDILQRLARRQINKVYLRSDNAGCYHGSQTIAAMAHMSRKYGVEVSRWDFSEPQAGKGPCGRVAANIKRRIKMYSILMKVTHAPTL